MFAIPTNNALLINLRLISDAEFFLLIITDWAHESGAKRAKSVHAMRTYSDWASILHVTVGGWGGGPVLKHQFPSDP